MRCDGSAGGHCRWGEQLSEVQFDRRAHSAALRRTVLRFRAGLKAMVYRKARPPDPELDRLLEERIDLRVRLVLLLENPSPNEAEVERARQRLTEVEARIALRQKDANRWNRDTG